METDFIGHECRCLRKNTFSTCNATSAIILQQILGGNPAITGRQENNLSGRPKLEPVTTCHLRYFCKIVVKILWM